MAVTEGEKAPDFHVQDDTGKPTGLEDFAGKPLVLFFYSKDGTSG